MSASARDMKASPLSRPHTTMTKFSGPVSGLPNAKSPVRGRKTRTDVAPMSTGAFAKHRNKYESQVNGKGNRH